MMPKLFTGWLFLMSYVINALPSEAKVRGGPTISSVTMFPKLNFTLPKNQSCWMWDESMEDNYYTRLKEWEKTPLRVFIVPFSHNDAGWLNTFEEYYDKHSHDILDNVARTLPILEGFRFVWTEVCFLERWWTRASEAERDSIRNSVRRGRLEIVGGGWVMPDEATTTLYGLLDQLIEGHQWVYHNLGVKVKSSWSLDPFGLSSTYSYLLSESEINFTLIQRIHWAWKRYFSQEQLTDLMWVRDPGPGLRLRVQPTPSYSVTGSCGPVGAVCAGFDFNPEISESPPIRFDNVRTSVELLLGQYGRLGSLNAENAVLVTLGTDFRFENQSEWMAQYYNYKAIFDYVNSNDDLYHARLTFATPRDYTRQTKPPTAKFDGDFFVYSDLGPTTSVQDDYWSGYFSSRPYWKLLGRKVESTVRAAEIMYSVVSRRCMGRYLEEEMEDAFSLLVSARRNLALFQHHDAITGTSRARVMADFERKLWRAADAAGTVQERCASLIASGNREAYLLDRQPPGRVLPSIPATITVFNSLMRPRAEIVRLTIPRPDVTVSDPISKKTLPFQVDAKNMTDCYELLFVVELKELELAVFEIELSSDSHEQVSETLPLNELGAKCNKGLVAIIAGQRTALFSTDSGFLTGLNSKADRSLLNIGLHAFRSVPTRSGAYLLRPQATVLSVNRTLHAKNIFVTQGPIYKQVTAQYGPAFTVRTRLYEHPSFSKIVEVVATVDFGEPWAFSDTEVFIRLGIPGINKTRLWTDTNGLGRRERPRVRHLGVAANYFPVTEEAYLDDGHRRLTVLCDHSHGVASLESGQIDFMIDRRILLDDQRGLEEGLIDRRLSRSKMWVIVGDSDEVHKTSVEMGNWLSHGCLVFLAKQGFRPRGEALVSKELPAGCHLVTLRTLASSEGLPGPSTLAVIAHTSHSTNTKPTPILYPRTRFACTRPVSIVRTSLTGVSDYETVDNFEELTLAPASVAALKYYFN